MRISAREQSERVQKSRAAQVDIGLDARFAPPRNDSEG
jgi:hypothetical protein